MPAVQTLTLADLSHTPSHDGSHTDTDIGRDCNATMSVRDYKMAALHARIVFYMRQMVLQPMTPDKSKTGATCILLGRQFMSRGAWRLEEGDKFLVSERALSLALSSLNPNSNPHAVSVWQDLFQGAAHKGTRRRGSD